jgi:MYND finger
MYPRRCTHCKNPLQATGQRNFDSGGCSRCRTYRVVAYCSKECLEKDISNHKFICGSSDGALVRILQDEKHAAIHAYVRRVLSDPSFISSPDYGGLKLPTNRPFARLEINKWLRGRPRQDVYKLLLEVFLCRAYTMLTVHSTSPFENRSKEQYLADVESGSVIHQFTTMLSALEHPERRKVLPLWWMPVDRQRCIRLAEMKSYCSCVTRGTWKSSPELIRAEFSDESMPAQLLLFWDLNISRSKGAVEYAKQIILLERKLEDRMNVTDEQMKNIHRVVKEYVAGRQWYHEDDWGEYHMC